MIALKVLIVIWNMNDLSIFQDTRPTLERGMLIAGECKMKLVKFSNAYIHVDKINYITESDIYKEITTAGRTIWDYHIVIGVNFDACIDLKETFDSRPERDRRMNELLIEINGCSQLINKEES